MNTMTDLWVVFARDRGQANSVAYRYDADRDRICRLFSPSDGGDPHYSSAPCPEGVEWNGSEGDFPCRLRLDWVECKNPFPESRLGDID